MFGPTVPYYPHDYQRNAFSTSWLLCDMDEPAPYTGRYPKVNTKPHKGPSYPTNETGSPYFRPWNIQPPSQLLTGDLEGNPIGHYVTE